MDPETDTPERLKAWGAKFGAKAGWTLVTGEKRNLDPLLRFLTGDPTRRGAHSPVVLVGNYDRGVWRRELGPAPLADYLASLESANEAVSAAYRD